jgi:hypothetical protein
LLGQRTSYTTRIMRMGPEWGIGHFLANRWRWLRNDSARSSCESLCFARMQPWPFVNLQSHGLVVG